MMPFEIDIASLVKPEKSHTLKVIAYSGMFFDTIEKGKSYDEEL